MASARVLLALVLSVGVGVVSGVAEAQGLVTTSSATAGAVGDHEVLIDAIQTRLDVLAGRLQQLDDRMNLLRDTALGGDIAQTRAVIIHKNELGSSFALERARYMLDGGVLLDKVDDNGNLAEVEEQILFDGRIAPGEHLLEVEIICRGGGFGLFSYVEAYRFKVSSRYVIKVREGRVNRLEVVAFQRPDITLEAPKRLTIRYDYEVLGGPAGASDAP